MGSMDSNVRRAMEQGKEMLKPGSNPSSKSINAVITILANHAANNSQANDLRKRLEALKKK